MTSDPVSQTIAAPVSRSRLLLLTGGALGAAVLIVLGVVLPAEAGIDVLGVGRLTGVSRLWAPPTPTVSVEGAAGPLAREFPQGFRTDEVLIPLGDAADLPIGPTSSELEYKVRMRKGAVLTYSWSVEGPTKPGEFRYDFHGQTVVDEDKGEKPVVADYSPARGLAQQGALTAPFDGVHGWWFQNAAPRRATVRLKLAGFYELVPPGEVGNEANISANTPASRSRLGFK